MMVNNTRVLYDRYASLSNQSNIVTQSYTTSTYNTYSTTNPVNTANTANTTNTANTIR